MHADNCFDVPTYQRFAAGQLAAAEMDRVAGHLEQCESCLRVVRELPEDSFVASLRAQGDWPSTVLASGFVRNVVEHVLKQREASSQVLSGSVAIACPGCGKPLRTKSDLAGKKVKCPGCGTVMEVPPAAVASGQLSAARKSGASQGVANSEQRTILPAASPMVADQQTIPPPMGQVLSGTTTQQTKQSHATNPPKPAEPEYDSSLTDFLAPPQANDELGRLGGFRILKILGHGGMGVVFQGEDAKLGRKVAIKAMLPHLAGSRSSHERFLREAKAAAGLDHPHIVAIHHVGEDRGAPFIVMPFLKGEPLDARLRSDDRVPIPEVVRIGREIAEGLAAAHEQGLMHRDIKPANIWLESVVSGESSEVSEERNFSAPLVKILDFGLARMESDGGRLTQSGAVVGTPAFMAPELVRGEKLDARCDLWSLGVVLYQMCTGELPFRGSDTLATLLALATHNPPAPSEVDAEVPLELSDLVMHLLEKDRARRIGSAEELVAALSVIEKTLRERGPTPVVAGASPRRKASGESSSRVPKLTPQTTRWLSPRRTLLAGLGGVAAVVIAVIFLWRSAHAPSRSESAKVADGGASGKSEPAVVETPPSKETEPINVAPEKPENHSKDNPVVVKPPPKLPEPRIFPPGRFALRFGEPKAPNSVASTSLKTGLSALTDGPLTVEAFATILGKKPGQVMLWGPSVLRVARDGQWELSRTFAAKDAPPGIMFPARIGMRDHVACVRTEIEYRLYVGGRFAGSEPRRQQATHGQFQMGGPSDSSFDSLLDQVRVSKSARYDKDFTPPSALEKDADTLILYQFGEGSGEVLNDSSGNRYDGNIRGPKWVKGDGSPLPAVTKSDDKKPPVAAAAPLQLLYHLPRRSLGGTWTSVEGTGKYTQAEISANGNNFFAIAGQNNMLLFDTATGKVATWFGDTGQGIPGVWGYAKFHPSGKFVVASYGNRSSVYLLNNATGKPYKTFNVTDARPAHLLPKPPRFALAPDGKLLLSLPPEWGNDRRLMVWDVETGQEKKTLSSGTRYGGGAISPDGSKVLAFSAGTLQLWNVESGQEMKKWASHNGSCSGVSFAPDGKQALSYGEDGAVVLWDATTGAEIRRYPGPTGKVTLAGLVAGGKRVFATTDLGFWIREREGGELVRKIDCRPKAGDAGYTIVAPTPDGRQALVGHSNGSVFLLDLATGQERQSVADCPNIMAFSFSQDGTLAVAVTPTLGLYLFRLSGPPGDRS